MTRLTIVVAAAVALTACSPVRITLSYRARPPSPQLVGAVRFGTIYDERRNRREVAPDVSLVEDTPTMLETTERIVREGLAAAGWDVTPAAPLRIDVRLHTAWAHQSFYNVQANVQLTVELHRGTEAGEPLWVHRFGVVDGSGGSDARTNHQEAFKKVLSKLAAETMAAFGSSTFAEAATARPSAPESEAASEE